MSRADSSQGLVVTYQGKLCGPIFDFRRDLGLEPGGGNVFVPVSEFTDFAIEEGLNGLDQAPVPGVTQEKKPTSLRGWQSSGDLVFSEVIGDEVHVVTINQVLLDEHAVESAFAFDDENELCRVGLTDIRYLWEKRGIITEWINVPKQGAGLGSEKADSPIAVDLHAILGDPTTPAGSADPAGNAYPPAGSAFKQFSNGSPPVIQWLDSSAQPIGKAYVVGVDVDFAGNLISASSPAAGSGSPPTSGPTPSTISGGGDGGAPGTTSGGDATAFIPGSTNQGTPWTLYEVLTKKVLPALPGTPTLKRMPDALKNALPIGHVWNGIKPKLALRDLLEEFQLVLALNLDASVSLWLKNEGDLQTADGQVIIPDTSSSSVDARVASSKRLISYKWVPAVVVVQGPPIIKAERIRLEACGEVKGPNGQPTGVRPLEDCLTQIGIAPDKARRLVMMRHGDRHALPTGVTVEGEKELERWGFKWFRLPGGIEVNADKLPMLQGRAAVTDEGQLQPIKVFAESHTFINMQSVILANLMTVARQGLIAAGSDPADVAKKHPDETGTDKALAAVIARKALMAANPDQLKVVHNIPFCEQATGFEIDHERGIVKFHEVQGLAVADGVTLDLAILNGVQAVEIEFAHTTKPGRKDPLSTLHRYFSAWIRQGPNADPVQSDQVPPGSAPLVIDRPDFQQIEGIHGEKNKSYLDGLAKNLAKAVFAVPQAVKGFITTLCRPVPIICTGQVSSVHWFVEDERPRTVATINTAPILARPEDLRTRAFGVPENRKVLDHVLGPKGMTR